MGKVGIGMHRMIRSFAWAVLVISLAVVWPVMGGDQGLYSSKLQDLLRWRCYSIELQGDDVVLVRVHRTAYSLGKYQALWRPNEDGCPRERAVLEDGVGVTIHLGERLGFHKEHIPAAGAYAAIYLLRGSDLPQNDEIPYEYRRSRVLIGVADEVVREKVGFVRYLASPMHGTWYDLQTGQMGRMYFPYRTAAIPDSGCAPIRQGAPEREEIASLLDQAESFRIISELETLRLSDQSVLSHIRTLGAGTNLVSYAARAPFVSLSRALVLEGSEGGKTVLAAVEILDDGSVFFYRFDENGRIRWVRSTSPSSGNRKSSYTCHRYPGDGSVEFSCKRFGDGGFYAFSFKGQVAAAIPDGPGLRKIVAGVDAGFRRLFQLQGTGELGFEEIRKGLR